MARSASISADPGPADQATSNATGPGPVDVADASRSAAAEAASRPAEAIPPSGVLKPLADSEKAAILAHVERMGRVCACNLAGVKYRRFTRSMRGDPEFACEVLAQELEKEELAEAVIFEGVLEGDPKLALAYLGLTRAKRGAAGQPAGQG